MNSSTYIVADQVGLIRAALMRGVGRHYSGSQLRSIIDGVCPDFDLRAAAGVPAGPGALRTFLQTQFPDLVSVVGKKGGDVLYLIGDAPGQVARLAAPPTPTSRTVNLWTAFASPGLGQEAVYDRINKSLASQPRGAQVSEHQARLAPISPQEFRIMAINFVESAPPNIRDELGKILEQGDLFYQSWINALKSQSATLYQQWGLYRVQAIIRLFRDRLVAADLPSEEVEKAVQALTEDQATAFKERTVAMRGGINAFERTLVQRAVPELPNVPVITNINDVRAIAISTINNMSLTEIRQISVSLGAVIDAGLVPRK